MILFVEIAVGLSAGLILTILFSSVAMAGEKIATSCGLGYAAQIDPLAGGQTPVVSQTLTLFLIAFLLAPTCTLKTTLLNSESDVDFSVILGEIIVSR